MRGTVDVIKIGEYKFELTFDSGIDPEVPYILWIYKNGEPLFYQNSGSTVRKYFAKKLSKVHLRNFCIKFANNEKYRNDIINMV